MSAPVVVLKFGGTSLGSAARVRRAALRVCGHLRAGRRVVAVVSAAGGTTDRLLARLHRVRPAVGGSTRETDRALSTGEDLSAALLAAALGGLGTAARSLRGGEAGVFASGGFGAGRITRVDRSKIVDLLDHGIVPVVSGFQGTREDGETVTLGRGGSDTSAVAIAAALGAARCDIITDVDAVYDRDPRLHCEANPIARLSHGELLALADGGAHVVHPDAARLALVHGVPLRVYHFRASLSGRGGTRIGPAAVESAAFAGGAG